MHNENIERGDDREDDRRNAVNAADDTGMVAQQEQIFEELEEDTNRRTGIETE
jgi:hypothetical protein